MASTLEKHRQHKQRIGVTACDMEILQKDKYIKGNAVVLYLDVGLTKIRCSCDPFPILFILFIYLFYMRFCWEFFRVHTAPMNSFFVPFTVKFINTVKLVWYISCMLMWKV